MDQRETTKENMEYETAKELEDFYAVELYNLWNFLKKKYENKSGWIRLEIRNRTNKKMETKHQETQRTILDKGIAGRFKVTGRKGRRRSCK